MLDMVSVSGPVPTRFTCAFDPHPLGPRLLEQE